MATTAEQEDHMIEARLFPYKFIAIFEGGNLRRKFNMGDPCNAPGPHNTGHIKTIAEKSVTVVTRTGTVRLSAQDFANLNKDFVWG